LETVELEIVVASETAKDDAKPFQQGDREGGD